MIDEYNVFAKSYRMAKENFDSSAKNELRLKLIYDGKTDRRIYNLLIVSEVVAQWVNL